MNIRAVRLRNFLSLGDNTPEIELSGLTTIVGPNGSGKTSLLRAIEVIGSHMIRPRLLPEVYHHNGDVVSQVEIEIDVEFDYDEVRVMSDFLTCACVAQMESNDIPYGDREKQVLKKILQGNGMKHSADMCSKMTVILRTEGRSTLPKVILRIGKGDCRLDVRNGRTVMVAGIEKRMRRYVVDLILDRASAEVSGLKSHLSKRNRKQPADLDDFAVDIFKMVEDTGDDAFTLGVFRPDITGIMKEVHRKFIRTLNFLGDGVEGIISFDTIVGHLFSRSIVKMSEMQTRPEEMSLTRNMQETDVENITGLDLARTLFLMSNSDDPATILRYKKVILKMNEMTGLDVSIQIKHTQNKKDHPADPKIAVRFVRDTLPVPAELVAGGDIELLTILTTLIGRSGKILLLDEPASSLHPNRQKEMRKLMRETSEEDGNQIVLVTHSPFLTDPYGREPLWRFAPDKTGTKVADIVKILSEHRNGGKIMQHVDVRSMMFQQGVIIVEGLSDKILIESADRLMAEREGGGPGITSGEWMILEAGGKDSVFPLSRLAEELGISYISVVDRDALMTHDEKTKIGDRNVQTSSAIRHINETHGLSNGERKTIMDAGLCTSANGGQKYDSDDFDTLNKIARSHNIHVLDSDMEGIAGIKKRKKDSKVERALNLSYQMRENSYVPEGLADLVHSLGEVIEDTSSSGNAEPPPS